MQAFSQIDCLALGSWIDRNDFSDLAVVVIQAGIQFHHVRERARCLELNAAIDENGSYPFQDRWCIQNSCGDVKLPAAFRLVTSGCAVISPDRVFRCAGKIHGTQRLPALLEYPGSGMA